MTVGTIGNAIKLAAYTSWALGSISFTFYLTLPTFYGSQLIGWPGTSARLANFGKTRLISQMTAKRPSSAVTLEHILAAARKDFAMHGFDGAKLARIAQSANVTKQLVYHYFKTKEELYQVVLDEVGAEVHVMLDDPDYDQLSPDDAVRRLIEKIILAHIERPYIIGLTVDQDLHQGGHVSRRSKYMPTLRRFIEERIGSILARGKAQGIFHPDLDPSLFYWTVSSLTTTVFIQSWAMSQSSNIDYKAPEGIAAWQSHVTSFILRSIRQPALPD